MKKLLFLLVLASSYFCYSQDYTSKYNNVYDRYEYYDYNHNLVGYKKWNSFYNRWDYYDNRNNASNESIYHKMKPQDPTNWNAAYQALAYKQQKYDNNKAHIDSEVQRLMNIINNNDSLSENQKNILRNSIQNAINEINRRGASDFSNDNVVSSILNYIFNSYNSAVRKINNN